MSEGDPLLRAESLSFAYGPRRALDDVSLALRAGEIVAVSGPNGSGKSTLLRVLAGLLPAEGGKVFVEGEEVRADDAATRAKVGYAPQRAAIWPDLTPYEQLVFLAECHGLTKAEAAVRERAPPRCGGPRAAGAATGRHVVGRHAAAGQRGDGARAQAPRRALGRAGGGRRCGEPRAASARS